MHIDDGAWCQREDVSHTSYVTAQSVCGFYCITHIAYDHARACDNLSA